MTKLLIVDDDEALLGLYRARLADSYDIIGTTHAEEALGLALEHKPDAIMLDLMMPEFSGFELCQNLHSMSYTATIPIFIVTGEDGARHREHCQMLGAKGYFQKPVDFTVLKTALEDELRKKPPERRRAPRVRMRVGLRLCGIDATAKPFEEITATEDASATGFFCVCTAELTAGTRVEVFMTGAHARRAGVAEVVRADAPHTPRQKYGFRFVDEPQAWIFQS